jgi:signal transduction histidine kinase
MRHADDHVRNLLQRTEQTAREQLIKTHGTIRSMRPVSEQP